MDADKRQKKKRPHNETAAVKLPETKDLNKKRKLSEAGKDEKPVEKPVDKVAEKTEAKEEKPWEGKEEQEEDYRWNVCENCQ